MAESESETLTQDEVYDLLSNARRRFVISHLRERAEPVDVMELSETVAAWENDIPVDELTDQQIKRVYVSLYQTHIPKLDESGVVDYDKDAGTVRLTGAVGELDTYLPEQGTDPIPWQTLYLALAAGGLLVYLLSMFVPLGLPPTTVGLSILAVFGLIAVAHYTYQHRANR